MDILRPESTNSNLLKRCHGCPEGQQWHPATTEFFSRNKGKKDKLDVRCKACNRKRSREYYNNPANNERILAQKKEDYQENRESILAQKKEYQSDPAVKEHRRIYNKAYNEDDEIKSRIRAKQKARYDRPEVQEQRHTYHQQPRVKAIYKAHSHNRRALEHSATGTHTPEQIQEQYKRQCGRCYYCQCKVKWGKHHVDHVIPLSRGGSNDISNLVIACPHCNQKKHSKFPWEFPEGGRLL